MNNYIFSLILCVGMHCSAMAPKRLRNAVTHGIPIGRMGDFLTWYIKAKYVAEKFGFPFLLNVPEKHLLNDVQRLNLYHQEERLADHLYVINYVANVRTEADLPKSNKPVFVVEHEFYSQGWDRVEGLEDVSGWHDIWNNTSFREMLRNMIKLVDPVDTGLQPPTDCISVALHVRTGARWDTDENLKIWYYKFPTMDFYINAMKNLVTKFKGKKIHATIFTDDQNPSEIMHTIMKGVGSIDVRFRCRGVGNYPIRNVLDDLEAMMKYDCLIRGMSGFAQVAHLLGDYKIVIIPNKFNERHVEQISMLKKSNYMELFEQEKKLS